MTARSPARPERMTAWWRVSTLSLAVGLVLVGAVRGQQADDVRIRIWQVELGTHIDQLPAAFLDPHCGTNGGPPSIKLEHWSAFATCPPEPETALHEVWFTEDDEAEYLARAYRTQGFDPGPYSANVLFNHKMVYSLLVDADGYIRGYRAFTDQRESLDYRYDAEFVGVPLRNVFGSENFDCVDLESVEGENPVDGRFVKELCVGVSDGRHVTIERHFLRKPGQLVFDPVTRRTTEGYFDSSTRLEVLSVEIAGD